MSLSKKLFAVFLLGCSLPAFAQTPPPVYSEGETSISEAVIDTAELPDESSIELDAASEEMEFVNTNNNTEYVADPAAAQDAKAAEAAKKKAAAEKKKKADLKKAVATAYAPVFYNNKFDYLKNPDYKDHHLGEGLKQQPLGEHMMLDLGGQYRARLHDERNMRGFGLTGVDDDFVLQRTRLYSNLKIGDNFRFYGEFIDADSSYENFAPRGIEVNRADMQNLFMDARLSESFGGGETTFRIGRQELIYGAQRTVSPLDWANTRRTFEGINTMFRSDDWAIDGFLTRPVITNPEKFDSPSYDQSFDGIYATYKGKKDQTFDFYYLYFSNENLPTVTGTNGIHFSTLGSRWTGSKDDFLWEAEGAYQLGENDNGSSHNAGFFVTGLGKKIKHEWKPTLWGYLDFSTGGNAQGQRQGYDHLFPLGHKYHGFMDLYARSNIITPNVLLEAQPHEKVKLLAWYHYFYLQNGNDTPYNINMSAFNPANKPASRDLGHEIDLTFQYLISPRSDLLFGYSHFFHGEYYNLTPGVPFRGDADFFYTQYSINF